MSSRQVRPERPSTDPQRRFEAKSDSKAPGMGDCATTVYPRNLMTTVWTTETVSGAKAAPNPSIPTRSLYALSISGVSARTPSRVGTMFRLGMEKKMLLMRYMCMEAGSVGLMGAVDSRLRMRDFAPRVAAVINSAFSWVSVARRWRTLSTSFSARTICIWARVMRNSWLQSLAWGGFVFSPDRDMV